MGSDFKPLGDPLGNPSDLGLPKQDFGITHPGADNFQQFSQPSFQQPQQFQQPSFQPQQQFPAQSQGPNRDLDLVLAKLDAIKAELDSLHQRVMKIERIAEVSNEPPSNQAVKRYAREY